MFKVIKSHEDAIADVAAELAKGLKQGGTVIVPTDTVYGLAGDARNNRALAHIFAIKGRQTDKALPVLVRDIAMAHEVASISPEVESFLEKIWPGAVTVVLPTKGTISSLITHSGTIGLRVAAHHLFDVLFRQFPYPLAMTSANHSGEQTSHHIADIITTFQEQVLQPDIVVDAGDLTPSQPSTVIDLSTDIPRVLREGAVPGDYLLSLFSNHANQITHPKRTQTPTVSY